MMGNVVFLVLVGLRRLLSVPQLQLQEKHHWPKVAAPSQEVTEWKLSAVFRL